VESALREGGTEPGLRLIETMRWDGAGVRLMGLHLARLRAGAAALGWAVPDVSRLLEWQGGPARLRLTCNAAGKVALEAGPLPPVVARWRVGLAAERLDSVDPWLGVKTTRRAAYEAARAGMVAGLDEVVLLNERGEVCDGTITTVFFDRGQGLRTPPLRSGVLPGVLRAALGVPEEVLMGDDLGGVRLWLGNAMRGLIMGEFVGGPESGPILV
jgi:4-amino-4-deoxychorismate lyase